MIKIISKIVSYIFHPLLMATWFVLLLLYTNPFSFAGMPNGIVIGVVFVNTFMFPAIALLLMRKLDFIDSLELPDKKQRIIPLVATIVFYVWAFLAIKKLNFPFMVGIFMLGSVVSLFLAFFINIFSKISLHIVGISGALTAIMLLVFISPADVSYYFLLLIVLTGAVATARLYLNAHTIKEVYAGFIVGMIGQIFGLILYHP